MRAKILVASTVVVVALTAYPASQGRNVAGPSVAGQILVKFRPGANASDKAEAHRQAGGTRRAAIQRTGVELVGVAAGGEAASIAQYQRNPHVLFAEPNFIRSIPEPTAHAAGSQVVPGDYHFEEEWGLHNTGQMFYCFPIAEDEEWCFYIGKPDADIDAPEAWALSQGSSSVKVAVIDTGIDSTHPDLAANYIGGYDFVFDDPDPADDHGHGTHVAGTIAAAINNLTGDPGKEEGVVGVAPHARILAYKVCRSDGTCDDFAIQQAIARAITDGANVINMSLGEAAFSQSLNAAVQDAWIAGLVIVAGAGNDGGTDYFYPAAFDNVVSVAAFDEDHLRAPFSNYGTWVDISAPGNVIMSAYPMDQCAGAATTPGDIGCYTWLSGTSMSTPHVAGAAALVWSRGDVTSNSQVVDILLQSADGAGVATARLDSWTIHGGLNIHNAMSAASANQVPVANAGTDQTVTDSDGSGAEAVTLDGTASADPDGVVQSYDWREGGVSIASGAMPTVSLTVGTHTLTLVVTDNGGATDTDTVAITIQPQASAADTVVVFKAIYSRRGQLTIEATSSAAPDATLTAHDITAGANNFIGQLLFNSKKGRYIGSFTVLSPPSLIEVRSSANGSDTIIVTTR